MLLARLFLSLPLVCRNCGADMRIIAFIIEAASVEQILFALGEPPRTPPISPARPGAALSCSACYPAPLGYQPKPSWSGCSLLQRSSPARLG
jgi:hypothetical protein